MGSPKAKSVSSVSEAPGEAEAARPAGGALAAAGDEGRDGRDVIGISGVTETEEHGDRQHDPDGAAVCEGDDPVIESEHQKTSGEHGR